MTGPVASPRGFPSLYREIPTPRLLEAYEAAPGRFDLALEGLTESDLQARPFPGKWSIQEIVCHVADSETCGALRVRLVLAQPGAALPAYDQERFAAQLRYAGFDRELLAATRDLFRNLRGVMTRLLRSVSPAAWTNSGEHREWGPMTVRQLLELYSDHGERHLSQVLERRAALGKPLAIEPLLPLRLY